MPAVGHLVAGILRGIGVRFLVGNIQIKMLQHQVNVVVTPAVILRLVDDGTKKGDLAEISEQKLHHAQNNR